LQKWKNMIIFFWTAVAWLMRAVLSLRYKIEVRGLETCQKELLKPDRGILFLVNHPALVDPLLIYLVLWPRFRMRPIVVEYIFRTPWLRCFMKLVKAIPVPNFETSVNQFKVHNVQRAVTELSNGLKRKENFLLYPAGRIKNTPNEIIGGSSAAHDVIQEYPDVNLVLIRTTGLWGSRFSRALAGGPSPDLKTTMFYGVKKALQSLVFFLPRRHVLLEIETQPSDFPRLAERIELNRYLENWFNRYPDGKGGRLESEPLKIISYSRWFSDLPQAYKPKSPKSKESASGVSDKTRAKIYAEITKILDKQSLVIRPEMSLAADLGMDSLQVAELISFIGQNYRINDLHPEDIETVDRVLQIVEGAPPTERPRVIDTDLPRWPIEKNRPINLPSFESATIPEMFLHVCDQMGDFAACGDDLIGILSYRQIKRSIVILAEEFRHFPYDFIGVMLPASSAAIIIVLAIQLAGKTPVMLNWTLGPRDLDFMAKLSGVGIVISSWRFLEKISHVDFGGLVDSIHLIEDIRQNIRWTSKLKGLVRSRYTANRLTRAFRMHCLNADHTAVVLFTSGTEAMPKGVPLSHRNILSNLCAALEKVDVNNQDVLYSVLPPFHSFGFTVCSIFPLMAGVKVAFYPDPTDNFALAEGIQRWEVTFFCTAPGFLKGLFQTAKKEQLKSVRYFVTGAEKTSPGLYEKVDQLQTGARIIEGYGVTECSPIISLTFPNLPPIGVGRLLSNVAVCIIEPDSGQLLDSSSEGEICVQGPNVFSGYLCNSRSAFIEIEGKKWYRTGDIGHFDAEGNLLISGRLKRFAKIGGEMISLSAIEEEISKELVRQHRASPDTSFIAVVASSGEKPQFILFATLDINVDEVNEMLRSAGFSRLVKISAVRSIPEIPLLGMGKTDYRSLQKGL
jgi:long-chain-fatty-acid--[acyl-carrier-protein] ligase